jgi:hypothetical protein
MPALVAIIVAVLVFDPQVALVVKPVACVKRNRFAVGFDALQLEVKANKAIGPGAGHPNQGSLNTRVFDRNVILPTGDPIFLDNGRHSGCRLSKTLFDAVRRLKFNAHRFGEQAIPRWLSIPSN